MAVADRSYMRDLYPQIHSAALVLECTKGRDTVWCSFLDFHMGSPHMEMGILVFAELQVTHWSSSLLNFGREIDFFGGEIDIFWQGFPFGDQQIETGMSKPLFHTGTDQSLTHTKILSILTWGLS